MTLLREIQSAQWTAYFEESGRPLQFAPTREQRGVNSQFRRLFMEQPQPAQIVRTDKKGFKFTTFCLKME